ncbi:hypothetical protein [Methanoregula sp.]|uniref:hypothetical protein n=1 Tax=Methanoregula sp. TaxID=2052170 RepID=UPI003567D0A2
MKTRILVLLLAVPLCLTVLMAGCTDSAGSPVTPDVNQSQSSLLQQDSQPASAYRGSPGTTLTTVPIDTAYNRTLAAFWMFALEGPYATNPNWTSAVLDPVPVTLFDINGEPRYYEFYLRNGNESPGYFWTVADKRMEHGIFRIYEGSPSASYTRIARDAEDIVNITYSGYPILLEKSGLYGGGYPNLCTIVTILNRTSGVNETIVVDAYSHMVVPDHPSEDHPGPEYAWSYLDSIPQEEQPARVAQWEAENSNATNVVAYALARGIDPRLPLSGQNTSIIREYYREQSPDSATAPDETHEKPDDRPLTGEIIDKNIVPVDAARTEATAHLWRIVLDRPDSYADRSWRNAGLSKNEPLIIEDISGNKLYYVFTAERNGMPMSEIIVAANKGLYSHRFGLETAAGDYDFSNATQKVRVVAAQSFPGDSIRTVRSVYSLKDNCCHNVTVIMDVENSSTLEKNCILVDTYTLDASIEKISGTVGTEAYPSLFSLMTQGEYADNIQRWENDDKKDRDFVTYAASRGIPVDQPLNDRGFVALGVYIFTTEPRNPPVENLYNPLYPQPAVRPKLDKVTQAWHEQADWFSAVLVDASLTDAEIKQQIGSHQISGNYTLEILSVGAMGTDYYLDVPEADYNRTFLLLEKDGSVWISEQITSMWEYEQIVKQRNGSVIIPLAIAYPHEANARRLIAEDLPIKPMKEVYIRYDYKSEPKKSEREKVLAELNADDRILFAFKEYSS